MLGNGGRVVGGKNRVVEEFFVRRIVDDLGEIVCIFVIEYFFFLDYFILNLKI